MLRLPQLEDNFRPSIHLVIIVRYIDVFFFTAIIIKICQSHSYHNHTTVLKTKKCIDGRFLIVATVVIFFRVYTLYTLYLNKFSICYLAIYFKIILSN